MSKYERVDIGNVRGKTGASGRDGLGIDRIEDAGYGDAPFVHYWRIWWTDPTLEPTLLSVKDGENLSLDTKVKSDGQKAVTGEAIYDALLLKESTEHMHGYITREGCITEESDNTTFEINRPLIADASEQAYLGKIKLGEVSTEYIRDTNVLTNIGSDNDTQKKINEKIDEALEGKMYKSISLDPKSTNIVDLDNLNDEGFYYAHGNTSIKYVQHKPLDTSTSTNATLEQNPFQQTSFYLLIEKGGNTSYAKQTWTSYTSAEPRTFIRTKYSGTWGEWREVILDIYKSDESKADKVHEHSSADITNEESLSIIGASANSTQDIINRKIDQKIGSINTTIVNQGAIVVDATLSENSANPVSSSGIYSVLDSKVDKATISGGTNYIIGDPANPTGSSYTGSNYTIATEKHHGDDVYRRNESSYGTSKYADLQWTITPDNFTYNDVFTLSFYAKGTSGKEIRTYFYGDTGYVNVKRTKSNSSTDTTPSSSWGDGATRFTLTSDWKHYYVTYQLNSTGTLNVNKKVSIRVYGGTDCYISNVQLERGDNVTDYSKNSSQKADAIHTHKSDEIESVKIIASDEEPANLDDYTKTGTYYNNLNVESAYITPLPETGKAFYLTVEDWGTSNYTKQTLTHYSTGNTYIRLRNGGTWGDWQIIPYLSSTNTDIKMDGVQNAGSSLKSAKADHVHPTDTTRAPVSHATTATTYGVSTASNYGHSKASGTTPKMNGTASVGSETGTFARGDHVHPTDTTRAGTTVATTSANGLMSSADKQKLDGISNNANNYAHPTYAARTGVPASNQTPSFGGTFTITQPVSDATGHITGMNNRTITIPSTTATTSTKGLVQLDSTPTTNSNNAITSGAMKTALDNKADKSSTIDANNIVFVSKENDSTGAIILNFLQ